MIMTFTELKQLIKKELNGIYDWSEIESFLYRLTDFKLGLSRIDFALNPNTIIEHGDFFKRSISLLRLETPIQYIIGETSFYGLTFKVNSDTLIPRPETEELVDWIVKDTVNLEALTVLDIGTGSGCIPISLSLNMNNADVCAFDVSNKALDIAKINAKHNSAKVKFILQDILKYDCNTTNFLKDSKYKFDVIVSNPPYVRLSEKMKMKRNVLHFEPHLALFVKDEDPLLFYRTIGNYAIENLKIGGVLYFEINQNFGLQTIELLKDIGFNSVELKQDLSGNDRMIKAKREH